MRLQGLRRSACEVCASRGTSEQKKVYLSLKNLQASSFKRIGIVTLGSKCALFCTIPKSTSEICNYYLHFLYLIYSQSVFSFDLLVRCFSYVVSVWVFTCCAAADAVADMRQKTSCSRIKIISSHRGDLHPEMDSVTRFTVQNFPHFPFAKF